MSNPEAGGPDGSDFVAPDTAHTARVSEFLADTAHFNQPVTEGQTVDAPASTAAEWTAPTGLELNRTAAPVSPDRAPATPAWVSPNREAVQSAEVAAPETAPTNFAQLAERRTQQIVDGAKRVGGTILGFLGRLGRIGATGLGRGAAGLEVGVRAVGAGTSEVGRTVGAAWERDKARTAADFQAVQERVGAEATDAYQHLVQPVTEAGRSAIQSGVEAGQAVAGTVVDRATRAYEATTGAVRSGYETGSYVVRTIGVGAGRAARWAKEAPGRLQEAGGRGIEAGLEVGVVLALEASRFVTERRERTTAFIERKVAQGVAAKERAQTTASRKIREAVTGSQLLVARGREAALLAKLVYWADLPGGTNAIDAKIQGNRSIVQRAIDLSKNVGSVEAYQAMVEAQGQAGPAARELTRLQKKEARFSGKLNTINAGLAATRARIAELSGGGAPAAA